MFFCRINRARQPRFPIGIQDKSFELVINHLKMLKYDGPLGLACDDTKLLAAFRPYYDKETDKHYVLGSTEEPMVLANPDELNSIIKKGELEKATKVSQILIKRAKTSSKFVNHLDSPMVSSGSSPRHTNYCSGGIGYI
jgi:hypothetical protein